MGEYFSLAAEILVDLAHALHLFYAERAAALEMTAVQARVGLHGQPGIEWFAAIAPPARARS